MQFLPIIIEVGVRLFGYWLSWTGNKKQSQEWMADVSEKLREKGLVRSKFLLELEADREKYLEDEIKKKEIKMVNEPERPSQQNTMLKDLFAEYEIPKIVDVPVKVSTQGKYFTKTGQAKGVVVHYTAGRFEKGKDSALSTLRSMASRGLGCLVMDTDGVIYKAANQDLNEVAWHAGKSSWQGKTGISRYCIGMEICNAGKLTAHNGKHYPWWCFNSKGGFKGGQPIPPDMVRHIPHDRSNQKKGFYHAYTKAQEESLINFILWQLDINPEFQTWWICGHDEIAPTRKSDPGASLSMTMPAMRDKIRHLLMQ